MQFAYIRESDLVPDGRDEFINVLVHSHDDEEAFVISGDAVERKVKTECLIDAQAWLPADDWEAIFGSEEVLKVEQPDEWQNIIGKTRFFSLVIPGVYEHGDWPEVMWR